MERKRRRYQLRFLRTDPGPADMLHISSFSGAEVSGLYLHSQHTEAFLTLRLSLPLSTPNI